MKRIKNFNDVQEFNLSSIYGGRWKKSPKTSGVNNDGCTVETTESFNDTNGDGSPSSGESTITCTTVSCPE